MNAADLRAAIVECMARSDADFDGRPFDRMGLADRVRYRDRASAALTTVGKLGAVVPRTDLPDDIRALARDRTWESLVEAADVSRVKMEGGQDG